ncbi:hypothetical protein DPMN_152090 [Dreissena polymorpha]|uniref:Uncharacterized protein n=1 Tax=Dreissena polymorpha TaxID=45954 RepID=A0A9D4FGU4_DREPO|nr:hypothetical protein DPMN_152090 [Dreissena polymorpha]
MNPDNSMFYASWFIIISLIPNQIRSPTVYGFSSKQLETLQKTLKDYNSVESLKADQLKKLGQLYNIDPKFPKQARIVLLCYVLGLSTTGHIQTVATRDSCQHLNDDQQKH